MAEKKHKVRDVAAPRNDRLINGRGAFGICAGGLDGDGDITLVKTAEAAKKALMAAFDEQLRPDAPQGSLVRNQWVTTVAARGLLAAAASQLEGWADSTDGDSLDVAVFVPELGVNLKVGIFKAWYGPDPTFNGSRTQAPNSWTFPPQVRIPSNRPEDRKVPV